MNFRSRAGLFQRGFFVAACIVILVHSGCQPVTPVPSAPPSAPPSMRPQDQPQDSRYLGLSKDEAIRLAEQRGLRSRVVREDQERYPVTKDLRPDRVNFELDRGIVTGVRRY